MQSNTLKTPPMSFAEFNTLILELYGRVNHGREICETGRPKRDIAPIT